MSLVAGFLSVLPLPAADAAKTFAEGQKAERAGHMVQAYLLYSQAASLDPSNPFYRMKSEAVRSRAALESPPKPPDAPRKPETTTADPASPFDPPIAGDRPAERTPKPPPELKGAPGLKDFDLHADAKSLWQQVAHAFRLEAVFDTDYEPGPPLTFRLDQTGYREAMRAAEAATGSFVVPISSRMFLVVKDTDAKRKEREPTVSVSVEVPQATTTQELTEIGQAVRQLFNLEHMALDTRMNMVVMRDRISRVVPASRVFDELLHHRPQVNIEVELMEVDRTSSLAYGVDLALTAPITYLGTFWNSPVPAITAQLATFGGGQSLFGIVIGSATALATLSRSDSRTLFRSTLRAVDGTPSSMHVGEKFPVLTAGYFGPASSSQGGTVYTPPPSFTFEDLGITLKVTPRIHGMDEVTLDLETDFEVLTGDSSNGIPIISSRKLASKIRLKEGEWGAVAGLLTSSEARTISGLAGLSNIPVLGQLFKQTNKDENTSEVLLIIKPTLLNLPADQFLTPTIWTGSETRPVTPL